jgi:hypothetical protein
MILPCPSNFPHPFAALQKSKREHETLPEGKPRSGIWEPGPGMIPEYMEVDTANLSKIKQ